MTEAEAATPTTTTLSRQELHRLVWQSPLSHLVERFGVNASRLALICDEHGIPRPGSGHWTKLVCGKNVEVIPLRPTKAGASEMITIVAESRRTRGRPQEGGATSASDPPTPAPKVAERLARPHPLVADWIAARQRDVREKERVYDHRLKRLVQPVPLTPADRRRLLVADTLFKAVEKRGVTVKKGDRNELMMILDGERIEFQLRYRLRRGKRDLTADELRWRGPDAQTWKYELYETGSLLFEIKTWLPGLRREWEDGKRGSVEDSLGDIIAGIMAAFPTLADLRRQRAEDQRRHELAAQMRHAREQERRRDAGRFRRLLEHAQQWREAESAKAFLAALRSALPLDGEAVDGIDIADWLAWAERKTQEHDLLAHDPRAVIESIAEVTGSTYRDG